MTTKKKGRTAAVSGTATTSKIEWPKDWPADEGWPTDPALADGVRRLKHTGSAWPRKQSELRAGHHGILVVGETDEAGMLPVWVTIKERTKDIGAVGGAALIVIGHVPFRREVHSLVSRRDERSILPVTDEAFERAKAMGFDQENLETHVLIGQFVDRHETAYGPVYVATEYDVVGKTIDLSIIEVPS